MLGKPVERPAEGIARQTAPGKARHSGKLEANGDPARIKGGFCRVFAGMTAAARLLLLIAFSILAACSSAEVAQHARFDAADRSIMTPAGSDYLLGGLKDELQKHGFTVVVAPDWVPSAAPPGAADPIDMFARKTRYRLYLGQSWRDFCLTGGHRMDFTLSVFDLERGREMLRMSGRDCTPSVIRKFRRALETG